MDEKGNLEAKEAFKLDRDSTKGITGYVFYIDTSELKNALAWQHGASHEILRSMQHTGWFTNEMENEFYRGEVYHHVREFCDCGEDDCDGCNEEDSFYAVVVDTSSDCAWLEDERFEDAEDAANSADETARILAENEREYQDAFSLGSQAYSMLKEANDKKRKAIVYLKRSKEAFIHAKRIQDLDPSGANFLISSMQIDTGLANDLITESNTERESAFEFISEHRPCRKELVDSWHEGWVSF